MPFLGPVLAPLIAGACTVSGTSMLNGTVDWRWAYWLTMIWGGAVFLVVLFFLPETQAPSILHLKAQAIRRQTKDDQYYSDVDRHEESNLKLILTAMPIPLKLLCTEPIILALSSKISHQAFCDSITHMILAYLLVIYTILYMDFEGYSFLFANSYYQFNLVQVGLAFLAIAVGVLISGFTAPLQLRDYRPFYEKARREDNPMAPPEIRLRPLMVGAFFVPAGVFWLAWTARPGVYWPAPVVR